MWDITAYQSFDSCVFSFGFSPGVRLSFADVSEPSVRSIFKGLMKNIGKYPKENIQDSEHGENLKSRILIVYECVICQHNVVLKQNKKVHALKLLAMFSS
jgi:hypothetical protein